MKSSRRLIAGLVVLIILSSAFAARRGNAAQSIPLPSGHQVWPPYSFIGSPVVGTDPSMILPIGVGPIASGGNTLSLQISIGEFSGPVDIYFGIFAPAIDPNNVYLLNAGNALQPASSGLAPWRSGILANISETLFGAIPVAGLPFGTYTFYLLVTPAGRFDSYYLWATEGIVGSTVSKTSSLPNVIPITVNGSLCSDNSYPNKPCVSVTICSPGTTNCQTINDILLDTGSYGLRIFKQVLTVPLIQSVVASGSLAECVQFGDGSSDWGPVQIGSIILGNEPSVDVPIQVIDSTFSNRPSACRNADRSPLDAGFNGLLGVGPFAQDCGRACAAVASNGMYYACNGSACTGTTVSLSSQVQNPVFLLPQDNNGITVQFPGVPLGGVPSANGFLVLGVGTQSNNAASSVTAYPTDQYGDIATVFNGIRYNGFLDTGSNGLFFTSQSANNLPRCPVPDSTWFCPSTTVMLSATNGGASGSPGVPVSFQIGNYDRLLSNYSNSVFTEIGGTMTGGFDWGLPFFFGRNVIVGFEGRTSSLGTGPFLAY